MLKSAVCEGASRSRPFLVGEFKHWGAHALSGLTKQLLPIFRMCRRLFRRARGSKRLPHRLEAVANGFGLCDVTLERQIGVFAHPSVVFGLVEVGRR